MNPESQMRGHDGLEIEGGGTTPLVSEDGIWEWDGTAWVPRGSDSAWLGRFIGFSKRELDANKSGRLTFDQAAGLWLWAAIWAGLGIPLVALAFLAALPESFWIRVLVPPVVFTVAVYFCWRGFAAAVDAVRGGVAVTSGTLYKRWESDDDAPWAGAGYYYVGVPGVEKKMYRSAGERVPVGIYCRAYYAYGSRRLLTVEVAPSADSYASVPTSTEWARVRWAGIASLVGAFAVTVGVLYTAAGDPARRIDSSVAGGVMLLFGSLVLGTAVWRFAAKRRHRL